MPKQHGLRELAKVVVFCAATGSTLLSGQDILDCGKKPLAKEIDKAKAGDTIVFTGVCTGPLRIITDNITLTGTGAAVVDGNGTNAILVYGANGVTLNSF